MEFDIAEIYKEVSILVIKNKYFYLAIFFHIFLFLAIQYERSESVYKQNNQPQVVSTTVKTGAYKGELAKNFQLLNGRGEKVMLSNFRGKKVMINFFATWCAPCQEEMPLLVELSKKINKEKLVIIGVNVTKEESNPNNVQEFIKHFQIQFEVLYDEDGKVMDDYQLIGIPTTILINEKGKIVDRLNGVITPKMIKQHSFFAR